MILTTFFTELRNSDIPNPFEISFDNYLGVAQVIILMCKYRSNTISNQYYEYLIIVKKGIMDYHKWNHFYICTIKISGINMNCRCTERLEHVMWGLIIVYHADYIVFVSLPVLSTICFPYDKRYCSISVSFSI